MEQQILGMANIPYQTWGDLLTPEEALKAGTIFKELNKPFFADKLSNTPPGHHEQDCLLNKINQTSFILDDLTLYLDTHEEDQNALKLYKDLIQKRDQLKKEFAQKHYPLTRDCITACECNHNRFCWQEGPVPWEGVCHHVEL